MHGATRLPNEKDETDRFSKPMHAILGMSEILRFHTRILLDLACWCAPQNR